MNVKKLFAAILFCLICSCAAYAERYAEGEALVVFSSSAGVNASVEVAGASVSDTYEALSRAGGKIFVRVKSDTKTTEELIDELKQMSGVITVSPNRIYSNVFSANAVTPNDEYFGQLWGIKRVNAPEVWNYTTGSDTVYVAVVDSGVYPHPDLEANIADEFLSGSWDQDTVGHGTHIAGTIGAVGNNNTGVAGINWKVKIIPINVSSSTGDVKDDSVISALNDLATLIENGINIVAVNMSFGGYSRADPQQAVRTTYYEAFKTFDNLNKAVIVVAAGNEGLEVGKPAPFSYKNVFEEGSYYYPASLTGLNNMIVVGATDESNEAPGFTNWGQSVDIAAPGENIYSTYSPVAEDGAMYNSLDGTSMAAPHVTGAVALLKARFPEATIASIRNALISGANKSINPTVYPYTNQLGDMDAYALEPYKALDGAGKVSGSGLLDIKAAMDILQEKISIPEEEDGNDVIEENNENTSAESTPVSSSGGGGCRLGLSSTVLLALFALMPRRKHS